MKEANETGGEQASEGAEEREAEAFQTFHFRNEMACTSAIISNLFCGPPRKGRRRTARRQTGRARAAWLGAATELARAALN